MRHENETTESLITRLRSEGINQHIEWSHARGGNTIKIVADRLEDLNEELRLLQLEVTRLRGNMSQGEWIE